MALYNDPPPPFTSKTPQEQIHEVFLSFRGEDTRYTFTSHLYAALTRLQVKTYIDNELERGNEISPSLLKAIQDAKVSVIVFSENYASSRWCLDELVKIIDCKAKNGQIVVPVFYRVDPTHVRHQTGSYGNAFVAHEQRFVGYVNRIQTWRLALAEAANLSGWDCSAPRTESELVEKIASDIMQKLDCINSGGIERRIATYKEMAQQKQDKFLKHSNLRDLEDLITTMKQLGEMKMEKALRTDDESVWEDLLRTYQRILQLIQDKFQRTFNTKDIEDYNDIINHIRHIEREHSNRLMGFRGI